MPRLLLLVFLLACPLLAPAADGAASSRRLAITFDDAPRPDGAFLTGQERTRRLIAGLEAAEVRGAMIFATTQRLGDTPGAEARLRAYVAAGHVLANHSHAHGWLRQAQAADYLADARRANKMLSGLGEAPAYFRYPFLDEGRDEAQRDAVREGLAAMGLRNGYVTIDNYDWYLDALAAEARRADPALDLDALRDIYVQTLVDAARFYDDIARDNLGRSPAHVLLLHENDLAALFITDLVNALRSDGWEIIPAIEAYADPIAERTPRTLFNGQGRVAALAHEAGRSARSLVHPLEDEDALRALFVSRGLLAGATPPGDLLLINATLQAGDGQPSRAGMGLRIRGARIVDVAPSAALVRQPGDRVVDLQGRWLLPGLVGVHNHMHLPGAPFLGEPAARLYLAAGVTTLQTAGSADARAELALARAIEDGDVAGPRLLASAPYVTGPGGNGPMDKPGSADEARAFVKHWADLGVHTFKLYRHVQPEIAAAIVQAAHARRRSVSAHLCSLTYAEASRMGVDRIEHGLLSSTDFLAGKASGDCRSPLASIAALDARDPRVDALVRTLVENGTMLTSTLAIIESHFPHRPQGEAQALAYLAPRFRDDYRLRQEQLVAGRANPAYTPALLAKLMAFERRFVAAGGVLLAGPDTGRHVLPGFGDQRNFELLSEAGFALPDVVRIMSGNGARALDLGASKGQLKPGYDADLLVLDGDPAADPSNIRRVRWVFREGRRHEPAELRKGLEGRLGAQHAD
ncbi:amidohydrolase family protein [Arenimonas aestuarii]